MRELAERLALTALHAVDPETAHDLAVRALSLGLVPGASGAGDPRHRVRLWDLDFPNPLGLAAGFDKNADVPDACLKLGFGFVEVGTVTPRPQVGNPKPRVFRLAADRGVVNRLGFNNHGLAAVRARLARRRRAGIVGVNIGANKDSADRAADYVAGVKAFADVASYLTINVSSPNTPGLRDLQARAALDDLLARTIEAREATVAAAGRRAPLLLKIAPDIDEAGLDEIADVTLARGIDGLVVSNTTLAREGLGDPMAAEAGGLSGRPLFRRATALLAKTRLRVGPDLPIVGVGGIESDETALAKILAGANLLQLYTGLVYGGFGLVGRILSGLSAALDAEGAASLQELAGRRAAFWAAADAPGS